MRPTTKATLLALASTALLGTAATAFAAFPAMQSFTVPLTWQEQANFAHPSGGTGDRDASGAVKLVIMPAEGQVCYDFALRGVDAPLMAHVQRGRPLQDGPPIVTLFTGPGAPLEGCAPVNTGQLSDIVSHPSDYYVTLATTDYPDGALRGQLAS